MPDIMALRSLCQIHSPNRPPGDASRTNVSVNRDGGHANGSPDLTDTRCKPSDRDGVEKRLRNARRSMLTAPLRHKVLPMAFMKRSHGLGDLGNDALIQAQSPLTAASRKATGYWRFQ